MQKSILKIAAAVIGIAACIMVMVYVGGQTNVESFEQEAAASEMEYETEMVSQSGEWSEEERYLLAKIAMAEAEGESTEGKALVMLVVLNRVQSEDFPDSIEDVIWQTVGGNYQFSVLMDGGRWWNVEPDEDCWEALELVGAGWDESEGATYFAATSNTQTWHRDHLQFLFQYGGHLFYKEATEE